MKNKTEKDPLEVPIDWNYALIKVGYILLIFAVFLIAIVFLSLFVNQVSGVIYSGEVYNLDSGLDEIITWQIVNNSTFINATQISNTTIQITIPELVDEMNFSVIFKGYKNEQEKVIYVDKPVYSGGGGGGSIIYRNKTVYVNQTVEKPIYLNNNSCNNSSNNQNISSSDLTLPIVLGILAIILVILGIIFFIKWRRNGNTGE